VKASGGLHIIAPSATNRDASTTSCAAVPAARATRLLALLPVARRQPDAHLRRRLVQKAMARMGLQEDDVIESGLSPSRSPTRSARSSPQLRHPQEPARLRRRQQRPAQGHLPQRDELLEADSVQDNVDGIRATWSPTSSSASCRPIRSTSMGPARPRAELDNEFSLRIRWRMIAKEHTEPIRADRGQGPGRAGKLFATRKRRSARQHAHAREAHHAQRARPELERASRPHGLPAPGIHLRGYAQKQPKQEYKKEAFELFSEMLEKVKREVVTCWRACASATRRDRRAEAQERARAEAIARQMQFQHPEWVAGCRRGRRSGRRTRQRADQQRAVTAPRASAATTFAPVAVARSTSTAMGRLPDEVSTSPRIAGEKLPGGE
jgi:hypothetical protein